MTFMLVRSDGSLGDAQRAAIDAAARASGSVIQWRTSNRAARSYALLDVADERRNEVSAAAIAGGATVYDSPVIALAVFPAVAEALPELLTALGGAGRPDGVRTCEPCDGGVVVEWDLGRTPAGVVLGLVDVELRRFNSGRTVELLTPLPTQWIAKIAADGLAAPEMSSNAVLEDLIERADLEASAHV
ncbi:MAG: hypothetical protein WB615_09580 [Candidatus Tumulicola sp.]